MLETAPDEFVGWERGGANARADTIINGALPAELGGVHP